MNTQILRFALRMARCVLLSVSAGCGSSNGAASTEGSANAAVGGSLAGSGGSGGPGGATGSETLALSESAVTLGTSCQA